MLQSESQPAGFLEDADVGGQAAPGGQGRIESLDEDRADVPAHPFLEDLDQEAAELLGPHRAQADQAACLGVERALTVRQLTPGLVHQRGCLGCQPLDNGDELDEVGSQVVPEETVHLQGVLGVGGVHGAQDVRLHTVLLQQLPAAQNCVEAALPAFIRAVDVVHLGRAVQAEADEEIVPLEEGAPGLVQPGAVGLQGVGHLLAGLFMLFGQLDRALEEIQAHQQRLAPLPGNAHLPRRV